MTVSTRKLSNLLEKTSHGRLGKEKAEQLKAAAANSFGVSFARDAFAFQIRQLVEQMEFLERQVTELEAQISSLLKQTGSYITTIPGIGDTLGAIILSEIGDIHRFNAPNKLVAFAGLDVRVTQSGEFTGTRQKISKRCSPYLRRAIWLAASRAAFATLSSRSTISPSGPVASIISPLSAPSPVSSATLFSLSSVRTAPMRPSHQKRFDTIRQISQCECRLHRTFVKVGIFFHQHILEEEFSMFMRRIPTQEQRYILADLLRHGREAQDLTQQQISDLLDCSSPLGQ